VVVVVLEVVEDVVLEDVVLEDVVVEDVVLEDVVLEDVVLEDELVVELLELVVELLVVEDVDDDVLLDVVVVVVRLVEVLEVPHVSQVHPVSGSSSQPGQSQKSSFLKWIGIWHVASHLKTKSSPGVGVSGLIVNKVTRKITSLGLVFFLKMMVSFLKFMLLSFTSKVLPLL